MNAEILTYNRMPLASIREMDDIVGKTYDGDLLLRYDASRWLNINSLVDTVNTMDIDYLSNVDGKLITFGNEITNEIEKLRQENYELQQRLDKLEMLLGENYWLWQL